MPANLLLHVREHPEGRVIVTPVDFPNLPVDDAEPQLARVSVSANGAPDAAGEDPVVVRVYAQGRRQFVRDPRTGARVGDVAAVLANGRIDDFLLAALRL